MEAFLNALERGDRFEELQSLLGERWGQALINVLVNERVLRRGDRARFYPCPGGGMRCPREVHPNTVEGFPWVAIPSDGQCCAAIDLTDEDVQTWVFTPSTWRELLARLIGAKGRAPAEPLFSNVYTLGRTPWRGQTRDVLYAADVGEGAVTRLLMRQMQGRRAALVLVPTRGSGCVSDLEEHFGPGGVLEVVFLEDILFLEEHRFVFRAEGVEAITPTSPGSPKSSQPYAVQIDASGTRSIDETAYRELVKQRGSFDLLLDMVGVLDANRCVACRRDADGFQEGFITLEQALAYAELMERRQPLRAAELKALSAYGTPHKQIEAARRALDAKQGRTAWRSTKLLRGDDDQTNRYLFGPPEGLRWVLLRPLEES